MKIKIHLLIGSLAGLGLLVLAVQRVGADDFYKGKTIRFVCGAAPGGGYDLSARMIGRHMSKHIPGIFFRYLASWVQRRRPGGNIPLP